MRIRSEDLWRPMPPAQVYAAHHLLPTHIRGQGHRLQLAAGLWDLAVVSGLPPLGCHAGAPGRLFDGAAVGRAEEADEGTEDLAQILVANGGRRSRNLCTHILITPDKAACQADLPGFVLLT